MADRSEAIKDALAALPVRELKVLTRLRDGWTPEQICDDMQISEEEMRAIEGAGLERVREMAQQAKAKSARFDKAPV